MRAHLLERQPPLVTEDDFIGTYQSSKSSHISANLEFLAEHDVLPLTYLNPKLMEINKLVGWTMWSGCLQNNRGVLHKVPMGALTSLEDTLGMTFKDGSKGAVEFSPNNAYARIMSLLGVRQGQGSKDKPDGKIGARLELPNYITFLRDHKKRVHFEEREISNKVLIDFLQTLMHSKLYKARGVKFELNLNDSASEFQARYFANEIIGLFTAAYPAIGLSEENITCWKAKGREAHSTKISFKREEIMNGIAEYGLFGLSFQGHYHNFGDRPDVTSGGASFLNG